MDTQLATRGSVAAKVITLPSMRFPAALEPSLLVLLIFAPSRGRSHGGVGIGGGTGGAGGGGGGGSSSAQTTTSAMVSSRAVGPV